jgi:hypothetical protein
VVGSRHLWRRGVGHPPVAGAVVALVIEELWIILLAIAVVVAIAFALWSLISGDWNW